MTDRPELLDPTDRRIVAALQADPRASWSQLGAAVDVSETTVMRRVQRLREGGRLLVVAVPDPLRSGVGQPVLVYFRTVPGSALELAEQLARREDVRYVSLLAGAHDVMCEIIVPDRRYLQRVVMTELPDGGRVDQSSTALVLKLFKTRDQWSGTLLPGARGASTVLPSGAVPPLDEVDGRILRELQRDGRRSYSDIGASLGLSETTVARRIAALTADGRLYFIAMVDPVALGFELEAIVHFRVEPSALEATATRLVGSTQIRYLAATTGTSDLTCDAVFRDTDDLYEFLSDTVGGIRGIVESQVDVVLSAVKREYHYPLFGGTRPDPATRAVPRAAPRSRAGRAPAVPAGGTRAVVRNR